MNNVPFHAPQGNPNRLSLVVLGQPVSLKNNYIVPRNYQRPIPNAKVKAYQRSVKQQVCRRDPLLTGTLKVTMTLYYTSERADLDEALILDCLQKLIYKNDRQVREKHIFHAIDKDWPRAEILIEAKDQGVLL